ncbi:LPXTG cell wall anchor domain-containing protein [Streptomyces sp. NPDC057197]|uniref:LPXTG cell wall anchor domain-containing protein n=1 Tax=Streptomyces sp. NPDC057197 TaxID=3346045 RepID=UPI003631FC7D
MLTATAAGTLLGALWFVPSASASGDAPARTVADAVPTAQATRQSRAAGTPTDGTGMRTTAVRTSAADPRAVSTAGDAAASAGSLPADGTELADTGSIDTTPYVIGGSLFLAAGAGFVVYSVRRERLGF